MRTYFAICPFHKRNIFVSEQISHAGLVLGALSIIFYAQPGMLASRAGLDIRHQPPIRFESLRKIYVLYADSIGL